MFMSSSREKVTLSLQNSVTDVSINFRPPCWCPSRWAPAWRLHANVIKSESNISADDLVYEKLHWPEYWRGYLRVSFSRFWTLFDFDPCLDQCVKLKPSNSISFSLIFEQPTVDKPCSRHCIFFH